MTTDVDLAYAAGIIDGEGTIGITELRPVDRLRDNGTRVRRSFQHRIYVAVSMTDPRIPEWMKGEFGGNLQFVPSRSDKHKPSYRWSMSSKGAADFCELVAPFLRLKKTQAILAVEFYKERLSGNFSGSSGVPDDEVAARREYVEKIHQLNKRGT